jgi:AraC-like DNA-binding protein
MVSEQRPLDRYANEKGFALESYLLDCVRDGRRGNIEKALDSDHLGEIERLLSNDLYFSRMAFSFIWSKVVYASVEGGAPTLVSREYIRYYHRLQHSRSVSSILEMHRLFLAECADKVALAKTNLSPLASKVNRYIASHPYQKLTVGLLAQKLHYSRSHLSREYRKKTGETILAQIQHEKILEAKRLLLYSSQSLIDIWDRLGFCSQSHFTKIFRKETGMTPHRYREVHQNELDGHKLAPPPPPPTNLYKTGPPKNLFRSY